MSFNNGYDPSISRHHPVLILFLTGFCVVCILIAVLVIPDNISALKFLFYVVGGFAFIGAVYAVWAIHSNRQKADADTRVFLDDIHERNHDAYDNLKEYMEDNNKKEFTKESIKKEHYQSTIDNLIKQYK